MSTPEASKNWQKYVLDPVPAMGRFLVFDMRVGQDPRAALARLSDVASLDRTVIGLGLPLVLALGKNVPGLRAFPAMTGPGCAFPSTQGAVWAFIPGADLSDVHDRSLAFAARLGDGFVVHEEVSAFRYLEGKDLTGYEDGTENPKDDLAIAAAIVSGKGAGLDGSTFVAVQKWVHDLASFAKHTQDECDATFGRRRATNEEIPDAAQSAHVKRAAQESFDPPAFMVRRSMPWGGVADHGLYFVAYGESLDRFERVLARMSGKDDGVVDALLGFSRAVSGGYYWCPPIRDAKLDLSYLGV